MISILIPVYDVDVRDLVQELHDQGNSLEVPFEIICIDDASKPAIQQCNGSIGKLEHCNYTTQKINIGRAKIRNLLAEQAQFPYLLFLDCDAKIIRTDFLRKYQKKVTTTSVLVGGRVYPDDPGDEKKRLHWKVGRYREQRNHSAFQSNNFMIAKTIFRSLPFDESLRTYGHEDTLFGHQLINHGITIQHLDNPVLHVGLEEADEFLKKQEQAIENLIALKRRYPDLETKLTLTVAKARQWRIAGLLYLPLKIGQKRFLKFLARRARSLLWLDLYKIGYYLKMDREGLK